MMDDKNADIDWMTALLVILVVIFAILVSRL